MVKRLLIFKNKMLYEVTVVEVDIVDMGLHRN